MDILQTFESFATDFEAAVEDDDWSRLEKYLAPDATYLNVGGPDSKCHGREEIIAFLKSDVAKHDRRFDTRTLVALTSPTVAANRLSRQWRCTYTLAGAPDLVIEGEARYLFEGVLIKEIEEQVTPAALQKLEEWMRNHADSLQP